MAFRNLSFLEPLIVPIREAKQKFQQFVESPTTSPLAQFVGERQKSIQEQTAELGKLPIEAFGLAPLLGLQQDEDNRRRIFQSTPSIAQ